MVSVLVIASQAAGGTRDEGVVSLHSTSWKTQGKQSHRAVSYWPGDQETVTRASSFLFHDIMCNIYSFFFFSFLPEKRHSTTHSA